MTREEAIKIIRNIYKTAVETEALAVLVPELEESEDERLRKQCIKLINDAYFANYEASECLAWLEKQKERKSVKCIDFDNEFENQVSHLLASVMDGEYEYSEGFVTYAAQSLLGYAKNELKPVDQNKATINCEPVKQEWSEEDEKMINTLVSYVKDPSCWNLKCPKEKLVDFIKSLPERFNLQSKQEWSDEDQKHYDDVFDGLKYAYEDLKNNGSNDSAKDVRDAYDWLKKFKSKMYSLAMKEATYDVEHCGRRGRMGGVPREFSEKAEEYQKGLNPPYDADDIISAYESGMMEEEKEVEKAYKTQDDVVFRKGFSEGRKTTLEGLPKWKYAEHEICSSVKTYLVNYEVDNGDEEPTHIVIPTNYVKPHHWYMEIDESLLNLEAVDESIDEQYT